MRESISSGHFSFDQQVSDAMDYLRDNHRADADRLIVQFPEYIIALYDGSWFDTKEMGVDPEWSSWLADAIEATGLVQWDDGEPYAVDTLWHDDDGEGF